MMAIASMVAGLVILLLMWRNQRPAFLAGFLVIYSLAYRIVDVGYLDLAGPIYAIELSRHVGGNGASPMFLYSCLCFILPLWFFVSRKRLMQGIYAPLPHTLYHVTLARLALCVAIAVIGFLYVDMLRIGTIPMFSGMDRQAYNDIAGLLHGRAYEINFLLCASLGIFTVMPRLQGGRYSLAFAGLLLAVLVYWALTGNRFSAFLISLSFYALPFGAVIAMDKAGLLPRQAQGDAWASLVSARVLLPIAMVLSVVAIGGLLFNSYYTVRNYADPIYQISQRVLVQPVQTWASTWDEVALNPDRGVNYATLDYVVLNPPDGNTNTTVRYLMEKELGYFRANELIALGQQYAGGYPEIFFEIFGLWLALPLMLLFGSAAALLLYLAMSSLLRGRVLTTIMAVYIYFGFNVGYIGGMLNFLLAPTFAAKFVVLVIVAIAERYFLRRELAAYASRQFAEHAPAIPQHVRAAQGG
jgi:hypothetical protein